MISTSGSSIDEVQEIDDKLKILTEKDRELTKQINNSERQSDSLTRDMRDLVEGAPIVYVSAGCARDVLAKPRQGMERWPRTYTMPLMEEEPPNTLPRGQCISRPSKPGSFSVWNCHAYFCVFIG